MSKEFRIVFTIDIVAEDHVDAVEKLVDLLWASDSYRFPYYVQEHESKEIRSIDTESYPNENILLNEPPSIFL